MHRIIYIAILSLLLFSCKKKNIPEPIYGTEYYPFEEGLFVIYDVVSIVHDDLVNVHDTSYYQIKQKIGEEDVDGEEETYRKVYRYLRTSDTLNWTLKDVWTAKKSNRSVELLEENKRRIKLAFAISYDQYWDGNALNSDDPEQCYYSNIFSPYQLNGYTFDETVTVERQNFESYIEQIKSYEVYAEQIGLIYSHFKNNSIRNGDTLDVDKGSELYYTYKSHGFE
jgi:hypothetical protein